MLDKVQIWLGVLETETNKNKQAAKSDGKKYILIVPTLPHGYALPAAPTADAEHPAAWLPRGHAGVIGTATQLSEKARLQPAVLVGTLRASAPR